MKLNRFSKIIIMGFITCLMATTSTYAIGAQHLPTLVAEKRAIEKKVTVSEEEILNQLKIAESQVSQEEKDAFEAKWNIMTPQEKHDYLLPIYLDELNSLHTKLKIAENEVNNNNVLDMSFLQFYQSELIEFGNKISIISAVQTYKYSAYKPLKKAVDELYTLAGILDLGSAGLASSAIDLENGTSGSESEYENHSQYYSEFYNQAYEISLMREYGIEIDQNLNRMLQEVALAHKENLKRYKDVFETVTKCVDLYSKGGTDSTLYRATKNMDRQLYVDFNIRDTSDFSSIQIDENDILTPLAYEVIASFRNVYEVTEGYLVYAIVGTPSRMQAEMDAALSKAKIDLNLFEEQCNVYLKAGEIINQNIFDTITRIKADRQKIARANGYSSWELYQIYLESLEKAKYDSRVKAKATELAVVQKEYEEEMRQLEAEAHAEWLRNRVDFSKPSSQQNHAKGFYMDKALSRIKKNSFLSSFADLSLKFESQAFDELFRIRANGGDTALLQELYDSHPNEFSLIRDLYHYYK
ncbi:hypothetical protein [Fusibacter sp. 3D3]|uniref:hypothetical protein n=1 Tax=Fusibacter sp. 3D3 TaxID=1048380 RepID=UPI0008529558|nr:hypothetical protein [Fusibacter sp. 3D3]GAU77696.1 hypothetical protein F3D3_2325 [Fusibacter sp. 3D3]